MADLLSTAAAAAGNMLGDILGGGFSTGNTTSEAQYKYMESPEAKQWREYQQQLLQQLFGGSQGYIQNLLSQLPQQYGGIQQYIASILGGSELTPSALNSMFQPYINAANVASQGALGNIASQMNKYGVGGSTATAGMMGTALNKTNTALGEQLAGLLESALNRRMQAAQLGAGLPGEYASTMTRLLGSQYLPIQYMQNIPMPSLVKTGEKEKSSSGKGIFGSLLSGLF